MAETGLNQNWNRDYDPIVGRYIESDPIGLKGGINTYGYVGQKPLTRVDRRGLQAAEDPPELSECTIWRCHLCESLPCGTSCTPHDPPGVPKCGCYEAALTEARETRNLQVRLLADNFREAGNKPKLLAYIKVRDPQLLNSVQSGQVPEVRPFTTTCRSR